MQKTNLDNEVNTLVNNSLYIMFHVKIVVSRRILNNPGNQDLDFVKTVEPTVSFITINNKYCFKSYSKESSLFFWSTILTRFSNATGSLIIKDEASLSRGSLGLGFVNKKERP